VTLRSSQTLLPNYNENQQILDFLESLKAIAALDTPKATTPLEQVEGAPGGLGVKVETVGEQE